MKVGKEEGELAELKKALNLVQSSNSDYRVDNIRLYQGF